MAISTVIVRGFSCWKCNRFEAKDVGVNNSGVCRGDIPQTDPLGAVIPRTIPDGNKFWCGEYVVTPRDVPDPV